MDEEGENTIVASFAKNSRETICVGISHWQGKQRLFVRLYAQTPEAQQPVPTKEGVTLPVEQYPTLLEGVRALAGTSGKEIVTAKIDKNKSQQVWVGANIYKEMPLIYIRTYLAFAGSQELKPAKQGVSIRAELYPKLLDAVEQLGKALAKDLS
jgi:hypothetical protein